MRNKELVDRRFDQIDGKVKHLKFLLSRQSSIEEFKTTLSQLEETLDDLKSMIERDGSPLRNG